MGMLEGKTALVTGGARGLGKKIVERLAAEGALVAFNYATSSKAAADIVRSIESKGGEAFAIQMELGPDGAIETLAQTLDAEFKRRKGDTGIDILVNNIGGGSPARIESTTPELLDQAISLNFRAPFLLTRALMPRLRDGGRVVNISSATVRIAFEDAAAYVCSKAALDAFSRLLAKGLGGRGITVNSVGMGRTAGDSNAEYYANPAALRQMTDVTALRRIGTEDDVVGVVFALISPDGGWITGQVIDATGGFMI
jgi:NAD(P)-dependent dehydrogenase (short-subunit alcohol dehydrogenase family)